MPRVSAAFFTLSVTCLFIGMGWGMHMAKAQDFVMAPAHAHLNLLGGVLSAVFGTFYALTKETYSPRLAWINLLLSVAALSIMVPMLAILLQTGDEAKYGPIVGMASGIMVLSLLVFAISVLRELFRKRA